MIIIPNRPATMALCQKWSAAVKFMIKKYSGSATVWVIIFIIAIVGALVLIKRNNNRRFVNQTNRQVALACTTDQATTFHIHPNLKILINGQEQVIPSSVGNSPTCLKALHMHDNSGKIHTEAPTKRDFTLGDFFAVWNKNFNRQQILDYSADSQHKITETINGVAIEDYENTILRDNDQIVISYEAVK